MKVFPSQAISMIEKFIRAGLVPMMVGSPGMGKSAIVKQIAKTYNLKLIDVRLSQCDPTDLNGFPWNNGRKASYLPFDTFPIEGDPIPEGYAGWLLFLDEMNGGLSAVQKAAYKIILDKMVGNHPLHKNVAIVAAGNLETDNAAVEAMSTALQSRMVHLELVSHVPSWMAWAFANDIDHRITSFIEFKPDALYQFNPDHTDNTYACNRTWEFVDRVLKVTASNDPDLLPMVAGTISEGMAREFLVFCKLQDDLPKMHQIISSPELVPVPREPSVLFALTGALASNATEDNIANLMTFIKRLPSEFQVVTLKAATKRNRKLRAAPAITKWIMESPEVMLD